MRRPIASAIVAAGLATAPAAAAHVTGVSRGEYTPAGATVRVELAMRAEEAALAGPAPRDLVEAITMTADGDACSPHFEGADPEAPDGLRMRATFTCPHAPSRLHVRFGLLDRLPAGHRHLATVHLPSGDVDALAVLANPELGVDVAPACGSFRRMPWGLLGAGSVLVALAYGVARAAQRRR